MSYKKLIKVTVIVVLIIGVYMLSKYISSDIFNYNFL